MSEREALIERANRIVAEGGPHEWGYRDPVDGTFIVDNFPFEAADALAALAMPDREAIAEPWQPIETATGTRTVLGYLPGERESRRVTAVQLRDGKPWIVGSIFAFDLTPVTHWMPCPAAPLALTVGGGLG